MAGLVIAAGAAVAASAAELSFDLKIERGRVAEDMRLIRVKQGDAVKLRWTSDQPLAVHLHGYDIEKRIAPGATTEMTFTAHATGRFPIHVHAHGAGGERMGNRRSSMSKSTRGNDRAAGPRRSTRVSLDP